jgi:hypothetical protein
MDADIRCARPRRSRGPALAARAAAVAVLGLQCALAAASTSILFIGNSFTYGALSDVQGFRPDTVTDLNATGIGGVPALFKAFTQQAGLDYQVSLETEPGSGLDFHWDNRLTLIDRPWDKVVMHGQSTLDFGAPGNPGKIVTYSGLLSEAFHARNPAVDVSLSATWARADQTYLPTGHWYGQPISAMAYDVQAGYALAKAVNGALIDRVNPVGLAWNRAMEVGVADPNPYDGITTGQLDLWASDHYHASNYGYYLHALTVFGMVTGVDPRSLGGTESAAAELGFSASEAYALQSIAWEQIQAIPEPSSLVLMALGAGVLLLAFRRRKQRRR